VCPPVYLCRSCSKPRAIPPFGVPSFLSRVRGFPISRLALFFSCPEKFQNKAPSLVPLGPARLDDFRIFFPCLQRNDEDPSSSERVVEEFMRLDSKPPFAPLASQLYYFLTLKFEPPPRSPPAKYSNVVGTFFPASDAIPLIR